MIASASSMPVTVDDAVVTVDDDFTEDFTVFFDVTIVDVSDSKRSMAFFSREERYDKMSCDCKWLDARPTLTLKLLIINDKHS